MVGLEIDRLCERGDAVVEAVVLPLEVVAEPPPSADVVKPELNGFLHVCERLVVESLLRKGPAAPVEGVETVRGEQQDSSVIRGDRLIEVFFPVRLVAFFQFLAFGRLFAFGLVGGAAGWLAFPPAAAGFSAFKSGRICPRPSS